MNTNCILSSLKPGALQQFSRRFNVGWPAGEFLLLLALLMFINWPLWNGQIADTFIFFPSMVREGQWWRILTHPFVHVSWYHLVLDGSAVAMLYHQLMQSTLFRRLGYLAASTSGSLLFSIVFSPAIDSSGLCGLSGVAHGLMAAVSLELLFSPANKTAAKAVGGLCLAVVAGKSMFEAFAGHAAFDSLHFGLLGTPVVACHGGGVIGATVMFVLFFHFDNSTLRRREQPSAKVVEQPVNRP